ncbi:fungal-specific transcription factor domain-containing protein [Mycena vitilis]|nr:fungal-specific transcription factor domain-containing protein [Mycena vitilis]
MSSNDEDEQDAGRSKKRRIARACDICRRKKIRCDGAQMPGNRCSNCIAYTFECSYVEQAKKRGPPKGYVESMEIRVEKIERLLQTILPEAEYAHLLSEPSLPSSQVPPINDDDERVQFGLSEHLGRLSLNSDHDDRFFGRSSGAMLLQTALNVKLDAEPQNARRHTEFWASRPSPAPVPPPQYNFPPPDLAASLIDLYFTHINLVLPLLHRPTFARDLGSGLHLLNDGFAATYLLVCAIGARYSSDSRVLLDGSDNLHSCGWRWFEQLQLMRDPLGPPPSLYDLQFSALSVIFLHGTSAPESCWTLVSVGISMAQDVGAHRRKESTHRWTAEDELWKRAFWVLVYLDRTMSCNYGRPCAIQDEDFDLEFPIDVDDEFWETPDPADAFQQPIGTPSRISAFIVHLRLCQVLSFALRTVYSINKSKVLLGLSKGNTGDLENRVLAELDSALNKWIDGMPDHLRWNPTHEHPEFFEQSVVLYCNYYHLQILIHRAYIPSPKKMAPLAFPSLAICLNAARSCSHVIDIHRQRVGDKPLPLVQASVFTAAVVMLLNIWAGKRGGLALSTDSGKEMTEVHRCMQMLRGCETRWSSAGKLWDLLFDLASAGQLQLPATANTKKKRERGAEEPKSATSTVSAVDRAQGSLSPDSGDSATHNGNLPARGRQPVVTSDAPAFPIRSGSVPPSRPIAGGRRLHTSDVPAITTQFPPRFQPPTYPPDTPLSSSSLHSQQDMFAIPIRADEIRHRSYATSLSAASPHARRPEPFVPSQHEDLRRRRSIAHLPPLPPDTPVSASSIHSQQHDAFMSSVHHSQPHGHAMHSQPNTPVSTLSAQGVPLVPSMNNGRARAGQATSQVHWYPGEAKNAPAHTHPPLSSPNNQPAAGSNSFPISEAFYDHLTASFSSPPQHERSLPYQPITYAEQVRDVYPDGSRHRLQSNVRGGDMDQDAMSMWSAAPIGFEMEDWNSYLDTVNDITQARMHGGADGTPQ